METIAQLIQTNPTLPKSLLDPSKENMAALYKYHVDKVLGTEGGISWANGKNGLTLSLIALLGSATLPLEIGTSEVNQKNLEAIRHLNEWFSEPDELGEEFWNGFEQQLRSDRFHIP